MIAKSSKAMTKTKMSDKVIKLDTENELNKIIKSQKKTGEKINILFYSLWDEHCEKLVNSLGGYRKQKPLYLVDSFSMPHAFVIYKTTKLPHLVSLNKDKVQSEDYLPMVYKSLGL